MIQRRDGMGWDWIGRDGVKKKIERQPRNKTLLSRRTVVSNKLNTHAHPQQKTYIRSSGQPYIRPLATHRRLDNSRRFRSGSGERGRGWGWGRGRGRGRCRCRSVPFLLLLFDGLLFLFDPLRLDSSRFSAARAWAAKLVPENLLEPRGTTNKKDEKNTKHKPKGHQHQHQLQSIAAGPLSFRGWHPSYNARGRMALAKRVSIRISGCSRCSQAV